ncbi:130_t:CDS:2 [Entrophospora sp. SA101]|nr:130_t:CDS:2 [Entrophospora sp. SA101]
MLIGLDPNSTPGLIKKSFEAHDLKVSVDYRRDDTTGYVHLNSQMAKEVAAHIMAKGGLKVGTETVILRIDEAMYWGVYSGTRSIGSKTTNQYKTIGGKARHTRRYHKHSPYLTNFKNVEIGDDIEDQQQKHHINKCHSNNQHHKIHHYITKQKSKNKKKSKRNSKKQEAPTHKLTLLLRTQCFKLSKLVVSVVME